MDKGSGSGSGIFPDPDPGDQNRPDPDPQHWLICLLPPRYRYRATLKGNATLFLSYSKIA